MHTHRARGGAEASLSQSIASALVPRGDASTARRGTNTHALATHILDFRLRRIMRDGPAPGAMGVGVDGTSWELSGVSARRFTEDEGDDTPDTLFASAV